MNVMIMYLNFFIFSDLLNIKTGQAHSGPRVDLDPGQDCLVPPCRAAVVRHAATTNG